ncbi:MAG: phage virion morphogenesis protein [Treponema sp.]|jgi:phage virion morphogenesis protein|nr:phage virion morphogenesis protein [Treponema sp.]
MAGAGIEVKLDSEYQKILDALKKAGSPELQKLANFAGADLQDISGEAFKKEADPVTGIKWKAIKPRGKQAKRRGSTDSILQDHGQLKRSLTWEAYPDGSVIFGSNMVYARIHQQGGQAGRGHTSLIPARPYMGVPQDFDRRILNDPAVLELLGLEA